MAQGHLTSKVISVNFTSCGKNLQSLLNSPQLGPELHNVIPAPTTGCFKLTYIPFPEYNQSKCSFHFLVNVCTRNVHQSPCFFYFTRWHLFSSITKWQILKKRSNLTVSRFGLWVFKTKQEIIIVTGKNTHMSCSDLDISEKTKKIQNFYRN